MIRVLIVDDQALVRGGFRAILETQSDLEVVGEAADGREALAQVSEQPVDVVLMDVRMPVLDGIEATRVLIREPEPPRVLMLTTFDLDEHLYDAMKAGASGFLLKDAPREQLIDAVRVIARGDTLLAPTIIRRLVERFVQRPPPGMPQRRASNSSANANSKSSPSSPADDPTTRSPPSSSSAQRPSRPTSAGSSTNSASATASKQSSSPTNPDSSNPATTPRTSGVEKESWKAPGVTESPVTTSPSCCRRRRKARR